VDKSVNFIDTRAMKFIKKGLLLWLLYWLLWLCVMCFVIWVILNRRKISNYRFVRKSSAWVNSWPCRYNL